MTELERGLLVLGRELDVPPIPDLASRVATELPPERSRQRSRTRLVLVLAALAAAALLATLAIPEARSALLRVFGIGGAQIELVDELPPVARPYAELELTLGDRGTLAEARQVVPRLFELEQAPDGVYLGERGTVWFLYGGGDEIRLLVAQTPAVTLDEPFILKKLVSAGTQVEVVDVRGTRGYFIRGEPHVVLLVDEHGDVIEETARLARDVLVWEEDGRTVRLEGDLTPSGAIEIAEELRVRSPG